MIPFTYLEPSTIDEALTLLASHGEEAKLIAGGTGLLNLMKHGLCRPKVLIGLRSLTELKLLEIGESSHIGALATIHELETSAAVRAAVPLLAEACRHVATIRIRVMATLGGAVSHADPHLDTLPALIASDSRIAARSRRGEREIDADAFFKGYYETVLEPDELVTAIRIPVQPPASGISFVKFLPGTYDDYATVSVAVRLTLAGDGRISGARVALGAVGWTPIRASAVERALVGAPANVKSLREIATLVKDEVDPIASFRASVEYKRSMAVVHVYRALRDALSRTRVES